MLLEISTYRYPSQHPSWKCSCASDHFFIGQQRAQATWSIDNAMHWTRGLRRIRIIVEYVLNFICIIRISSNPFSSKFDCKQIPRKSVSDAFTAHAYWIYRRQIMSSPRQREWSARLLQEAAFLVMLHENIWQHGALKCYTSYGVGMIVTKSIQYEGWVRLALGNIPLVRLLIRKH